MIADRKPAAIGMIHHRARPRGLVVKPRLMTEATTGVATQRRALAIRPRRAEDSATTIGRRAAISRVAGLICRLWGADRTSHARKTFPRWIVLTKAPIFRASGSRTGMDRAAAAGGPMWVHRA